MLLFWQCTLWYNVSKCKYFINTSSTLAESKLTSTATDILMTISAMFLLGNERSVILRHLLQPLQLLFFSTLMKRYVFISRNFSMLFQICIAELETILELLMVQCCFLVSCWMASLWFGGGLFKISLKWSVHRCSISFSGDSNYFLWPTDGQFLTFLQRFPRFPLLDFFSPFVAVASIGTLLFLRVSFLSF